MGSLDQALNSLSSFLEELPTLCKGEPPLEIDAQSDRLTHWRKSVSDSLDRVKDATRMYYGSLTTDQRARIVSTTAVLIGQDNFTDEDCRTRANGCLDAVGVLDKDTASQVFSNYVKPLFQASAHPGVNLDTGRVKHNPLSVQNMYDDQPWKVYGAGCWNVMSWILLHIQNEDIETLWPLIIPPLLTLVDDYKPLYRIRGVHVAQALLGKVSASLLRRTGIDELISKALRGTLQNLTSDEAPVLLATAMPCYLALVNLVSPNDDEKRFNKLSQLVTEVIVPGWLYASSKLDVMVASVKCLQLVAQSLGAGSIRFLKVFIPQLTENLYPREFSPIKPTRDLQNASASCLLVVMKLGRARVPHWRLRILDAVLRCWVDINGTNSQDIDDDTERLKALLVNIFCELFSTSGHLPKDEVTRLQELDTRIFSSLLEAVQPRSAEELGLAKPQ